MHDTTRCPKLACRVRAAHRRLTLNACILASTAETGFLLRSSVSNAGEMKSLLIGKWREVSQIAVLKIVIGAPVR